VRFRVDFNEIFILLSSPDWRIGASRPYSKSKLRRDSLVSSLPSSKLIDRPIVRDIVQSLSPETRTVPGQN